VGGLVGEGGRVKASTCGSGTQPDEDDPHDLGVRGGGKLDQAAEDLGAGVKVGGDGSAVGHLGGGRVAVADALGRAGGWPLRGEEVAQQAPGMHHLLGGL